MHSIDILERLIAFQTISRQPNQALMGYVADLLAGAGIEAQLIPNETGDRANLYATIGPKDRPGVMLSGHTDVVPVEGQAWSKPPFQLTLSEGRYYGRGTTDMKGFVACALAAALKAAERELTTPLHLALSYDEEIGCVGVHSLIDMLAAAPIKPAMCIVGEPTSLAVATGHKGKTGFRIICTGREAHSALAPTGLNAIHLAGDMVAEIRALQARLEESGPRDGDYDIPYSTAHVGKISGGVAVNIVPNHATLEAELRVVAEDDAGALLAELEAAAAALAARAAAQAPEAGIRFEPMVAYPGLATKPTAEVVEFVKTLLGANHTIKVAFGTEGGLFSERLGVPTVICGPGSMAQGHKPDEYVEASQLERCDAMLDGLLARLAARV